MLSRSFFQKELQPNHVKHKHLPPQVLFEILNSDDQIKLKPVHYLVEIQTVPPSLKDDYHPGLPDFGNDQFPNRIDNGGEKMLLKHWILFRLMLFSQSKFQLKNQSRKMLNY